jgi:hypothetical protein
MSSETAQFQDGKNSYRIQFEIDSPRVAVTIRPGSLKSYAPKPQHRVSKIRITELGEGHRKFSVNFDRSYESAARARAATTEYAKRMVRQKMTPRKIAEPATPEPVAIAVAATTQLS